MRNKRLSWTTLMILLLGAGLSRDAQALANRVFVSARSGNDANACNSILTPCQTFAGAVLQLNPGGEAIVLDSGGYGPVTITQALTIEAPPGVLAFIHPPSGNAITINAGAGDTVVLRGLVLNGGSGDGITVNTVGALHVENCVISGFFNGLNFAAAGELFVKDTIARGNSLVGIFINLASGTAKASIDDCRFESNGFGLSSFASAITTVRDSVASGNSGNGFDAFFGELNIENCVAANNGIGIKSYDFSRMRVSNTTVTDNAIGLVFTINGLLLSRGNNTVEGNTSNGTFTGFYTPK